MARSNDKDPRHAPGVGRFWSGLWVRTLVTSLLILAALFGAWELVERVAFGDASDVLRHRMHLVRGLSSSLVLAIWASFVVRRAQVERDAAVAEQLERLEEQVALRTRELSDALDFAERIFDALPDRLTVTDGARRPLKQNLAARALDASAARARVWERTEVEIPATEVRPRLHLEIERDVTLNRELEAQVRHQEKMASLGLLAAGIAHDLGNPLASLSTELELLEGEDDPEELKRSLGVLRQQVGRMTRSLREIVDFAMRRGDDSEEVSVPTAIDDALRLVRHDPRWLNVEAHVERGGEVHRIRMVEDRLVLVLVNLLLNAADAMNGRGRVELCVGEADSEVTIRVVDHGCGMSPDVLAQATSPLFTTKSERRGAGLGLWVCDRVVREAGGRLGIESRPGGGTSVTMSFPVPKEVRDG
jgi:C4-dicarboxylate-specific signal transduction histidine kinase